MSPRTRLGLLSSALWLAVHGSWMLVAGIATAGVILGLAAWQISAGAQVNLSDPQALMELMGAAGLGLGTVLQTGGLAAISVGMAAWWMPRAEAWFSVPPPEGGVARRLAVGAPSVWALAAALLGGLTVGWFPGWLLEMVMQAWPSVGGTQTDILVSMIRAAHPAGLVFMLFAINVMAPLGEEIMFRGMLWHVLEDWLGRPATWVITSVVFAAWHFDPLSFGALFVVGAMCGWLRWWSRSLWPAILVHFANNGLATMGALAFSAEDLDAAGATPVWLAILGLALSAGAALLAWATRRETP